MSNCSARTRISGSAHAESVLEVIEAGAEVRRRHHFYVWLQSYVGALVPHRVAVCAAYDRGRKALAFEVYSDLDLPRTTRDHLEGHASSPMRALIAGWLDGSQGVQVAGTEAFDGHAAFAPLQALGLSWLLVHGVARPMREPQVETFFVFIGQPPPADPLRADPAEALSLLVPHLHATYRRVCSVEQELGSAATAPRPTVAAAASDGGLTSRELQILSLAQRGLSNVEIGRELSISGLTVKNHAQNIFRKLGVNNRTHAVARALSQRWIGHQAAPEPIARP